MSDTLEIATPHGPAHAHLQPVEDARGALVLGHGAGGGVGAKDLVAAAAAARGAGVGVALVEQPYRVAGRRSPAPGGQLDAAWIAVAAELAAGPFAGLPVVTGGRSAGARVACRTSATTGSAGVLCLAFPLHPPGQGDDPAKSRLPELDGVGVPTLVVQGVSDPFGMPPPGPRREIVRQPGTHALAGDLPGLRAAVASWLDRLLG